MRGCSGFSGRSRSPARKSVVASLWTVGDEPTQALMARFYENLWRKGLPPRAALRAAQFDDAPRGAAARRRRDQAGTRRTPRSRTACRRSTGRRSCSAPTAFDHRPGRLDCESPKVWGRRVPGCPGSRQPSRPCGDGPGIRGVGWFRPVGVIPRNRKSRRDLPHARHLQADPLRLRARGVVEALKVAPACLSRKPPACGCHPA